MRPRFAKVIFNLSLDRAFDYVVPEALAGRVRVGSRVRVSFRYAEKSGYVIALKETPDVPNPKPVLGLERENEQIPDSLIWLASWMAEYYCCPTENAVCAMLPSVVRSGEMNHRQQLYVSLAPKALTPGEERDKLSPKRREVLSYLRERKTVPLQEMLKDGVASASTISAMVEAGWLQKELRVVERNPFMNDVLLPDAPKELTAEQTAALTAITDSMDSAKPSVLLLHGVTASGKTEVYLQAISHCLEQGREAIVLVPEISLTPQTCERFRRRFGDLVSVMHSALSEGERFDEWTRINEGRSRIAVGARSALFSPFRKLGLIVVDEEHENSYKQDVAPRYNARDMAVVRGLHEGATVLLGSATPSLESYYNCERGRYKLLEMMTRIDTKPLPTVEVVDMTEEASASGRAQIFSRRLKDLIYDRLQKREQVILFLNRRGFATQMMCTKCGFVAQCDDCSISYTYHKNIQKLTCHLCGKEIDAPQVCPVCGDEGIRFSGYGTEKIETITQELFPHARILRMDADTMIAKDAYKRSFEAFQGGEYDILIGTQMIAKGLDFPKVTLVGVIQADIGLHLPDIRSGERVFQLITQVAGRAGRGDFPGQVIVQTCTPYHSALVCAARQDFKGFYTEEMPSRKLLNFPPESHMVIFHFTSKKSEEAEQAAKFFAEQAKPFLEPTTQGIDPMPSPLSKVQTFYRWQIIYRGGNIPRLVHALRPLLLGTKWPRGVHAYADVDPRNML